MIARAFDFKLKNAIAVSVTSIFLFYYDQHGREQTCEESNGLCWEDCKEKIDLVSLSLKEPILFYDEVESFKYGRAYK